MTQAKRPDEVARKALLRALQTRPADPVRTSLRELYQPIVDEPLPDEIRALLDRLEQEND